MNEPKNIGDIVRGAYEQAGIPVKGSSGAREYSTSPTGDYLPEPTKDLVLAEEVPAGDACSWLGKFANNGWAIRIMPRLNDRQWEAYGRRAGETWDGATLSYDAVRSLELLQSMFPRHTLVLKWPTCTKRTLSGAVRTGAGLPVFAVCGAQAQYTDTKLRDVNGALVAIARCDQHRGQL